MQRYLVTHRIDLPGGRAAVAVEEDDALNGENGLSASLEEMECRMIQEALRKTLWNRGQAADLLKISRWTLQRKMTKYDLGNTAA
jgi:DNA-binding NtrC family response regulator